MNFIAQTPVELLEELASRCLGDKAIESKQVAEQVWRGFTFTVDRLNIAIPFMGGFEILPDHDVQPVPWAEEWVRGIANVRGEIYTVVDFASYLGLPALTSMRNATLFMLPDQALRSVLMIDSKVNLKTFPEFLEHADADDIPERLKSCLSVILKEGEQVWHVVDVLALCQGEEFINVGRSLNLQ